MPLEELVKEIEGEAEATAAAIRNQGKEEAERITGEARNRAKELLKTEKQYIDANAERQARQFRSSLEVERKMLLIQAKEEAIERELKVLRKAVESELKRNYMKKLLDAAIADFLRNAPKHESVLITSKANAKLVENLGYKVEYDSSVNGFLLQTKDGNITLNAGIDRIVDSHIELMRNILSKRLFERS